MKAPKTLCLALAMTFATGMFTQSAHAKGGMQNQAQVQNNINFGITNLQTQIQSDYSNGKISGAQAQSLDAQLSQALQMRDQSMANGGYSSSQVQSILALFQQMNQEMASYQNNTAIIPNNQLNLSNNSYNAYDGRNGSYNNSRRGYRRHDQYNINNSSTAAMQSSLSARIENDSARGMLTPAQANLLRSQYNQLSSGYVAPGSMMTRLQSLNVRIDEFENQTAGRGSRYY